MRDRRRVATTRRYCARLRGRAAGRYVHCLRGPLARTWDRVFSRSWYSDSTARDVAKWKIPACERCNKLYSSLEEEMLTLLALCVDPDIAATAGMAEWVLRSLDPTRAKNVRDAKHREAQRWRVLARTMTGDAIPQSRHFPGISGRTAGRGASDHAFSIPVNHFRGLTQKIVRGIFTWRVAGLSSLSIGSNTTPWTMKERRPSKACSIDLGRNLHTSQEL